MEWLTEDPTWPIMLGVFAVGVLGFLAYATSKKLFAILAIAAAFLTIGIVVTERYIVTDKEQIRFTLFDLASFVANNRHDDILRHIDPDMPSYERAKAEMPNYDFKTCSISGINYISVEESHPPRATVDFVVFCEVDSIQGYPGGIGNRQVTLTFEKDLTTETWQIVDYSHQNPYSGQTRNVFDNR
ncbi:MAG: hypothetical protein AAF456_11880 [Planctomycetota bacterium]